MALFLFAGSLLSYACGGSTGGGSKAPGVPEPGLSGSGNACVDQLSTKQCFQYAVVREEVLDMLADLERAQDVRSVPVAQAALASNDPVVIAAGLRLLGPFASSHPDAVKKAAPHLLAPYWMVQQLTADVLNASPAYSAIAEQYRTGHTAIETHPWARATPLALQTVGFDAPYPGAEPYAPGDSPVTAGFATKDPVDKVVAHFQSTLHAEPTELLQLQGLLTQGLEANAEELNKLVAQATEEFARTQDPKVFERMTKMQEGMQKNLALFSAPWPTGPSAAAAKAFVAEKVGNAPVRVVVVYAEPLLERTIALYGWSLPKYAPIERAPQPMQYTSRPM